MTPFLLLAITTVSISLLLQIDNASSFSSSSVRQQRQRHQSCSSTSRHAFISRPSSNKHDKQPSYSKHVSEKDKGIGGLLGGLINSVTKNDDNTSGSRSNKNLVLTYLEINGFLMTFNGVTILIDPILEGPLDFGVPNLFTAKRMNLPLEGMVTNGNLPFSQIDAILLTQGLEDHAHVQTLTKLAQCDGATELHGVPIVAPPSAKGALRDSGMDRVGDVRYLRHGERVTLSPRRQRTEGDDGTSDTNAGGSISDASSSAVDILATKGALVGPPWQTRENGYVLRSCPPPGDSLQRRTPSSSSPTSIYIEPHVEFDERQLEREAPIDVVITPTVGQRLSPIRFDLVYGPESAVRLVEVLKPKVVVSMPNSDVETSGSAARFVEQVGSKTDFQRLLLQKSTSSRRHFSGNDVKVVDLVPGQDQIISL